MSSQSFWDKLWKDKDGKQAIVQMPNAPLVVWFVALIAQCILPAGQAKSVVGLLATASLFIWAALEIYSGKCYFRRLLGVAILGLIVWSRFRG